MTLDVVTPQDDKYSFLVALSGLCIGAHFQTASLNDGKQLKPSDLTEK